MITAREVGCTCRRPMQWVVPVAPLAGYPRHKGMSTRYELYGLQTQASSFRPGIYAAGRTRASLRDANGQTNLILHHPIGGVKLCPLDSPVVPDARSSERAQNTVGNLATSRKIRAGPGEFRRNNSKVINWNPKLRVFNFSVTRSFPTRASFPQTSTSKEEVTHGKALH